MARSTGWTAQGKAISSRNAYKQTSVRPT